MKPDLSINLAGIKLKNPLMNASGTFGFGKGFANIKNPELLGALVTKTITLKSRKGNLMPSIIKIDGGIMNSVGLKNEGIEEFIKKTLPKYQFLKVPVFVSIAGNSVRDYEKLANILSKISGISAIEVNTSCPNVHGGNIPFGTDPKVVEKLARVVKKNSNVSVIVKLTPNVGEIESLAKAAEKGGADAISLINTVLGLAINVNTKKPYLGGNTGGISGPAIKSHGVYRTYEAFNSVKIPIIGIGGISSYKDVLEYIIAGATAVGIGTANYSNSKVIKEILLDLENYMIKNNIERFSDLAGSLEMN